MPLHYSSGILKEHHHTREKASLFDVSHMGQLCMIGEDVVEALERVVVGNLRHLNLGQMLLHAVDERGRGDC